MFLQLVKPNDPALTYVCEPFNFDDPSVDPISLAKEMVKFMYDSDGIGLSANQLGLTYRVFSMRGDPENFVCFNPKIVSYSKEEVLMEEGCLTYPGLLVKIKRPQHIRCRFTTPNGETMTKEFTGMTSRIFQHQMDYLNGILFFNNANIYHREQALKKWRNGEKYEMKVNLK